MKKLLYTSCCLLVVMVASVQALEVPPKSGKRLHNASTELKLSAVQSEGMEDRLDQLAKDHEGLQPAILIIDSLEGGVIEDFSLRVAEAWKLGRKRDRGGGDKGLLLVVAVRDRKYRFEVGYGLEGILPDSLVGSIGRDALVPAFREGRYLDGMYRALGSIGRVLDRGRQPEPGWFTVPPLGDKRFHNHSTLLKLQDFETSSLETGLDRFEWGLENLANMRMAILVVDSLQGEPIDSLSGRVAEAWQLGRKDGEGDNGLLLVLAMQDRKYRFTVGRKIEGLLPETLAEAIARDIMIQDFWAGQYERGLRYTIEAVTYLAQGEYPQSVALAEQDDDRGSWERLVDFVHYGKFAHPTSYDYLYGGEKKADPAWGGQAFAPKADHSRWVLILMIVTAGGFGIYHYLLGGAVGLFAGVVFSWMYVGHALPVVLLAAAIGLALGVIAKYLAAFALMLGITGGSEGGGFGGGGASGSW